MTMHSPDRGSYYLLRGVRSRFKAELDLDLVATKTLVGSDTSCCLSSWYLFLELVSFARQTFASEGA
jgi:hypothetical protein